MPEPNVDNPNTLQKQVIDYADVIDHETNWHKKVIGVATAQLNNYLGRRSSPPELEIKYDEGPKAESGKKTVVLRPYKWIRNEKLKIPAGVSIHEVAHCLEDDFLGLDPERDTDTACYFGEGFAEFISIDDPGKIRDALHIDREIGSYERIREEVNDHTSFGKMLTGYMSLDKLFSVRQPELEPDDLPEYIKDKTLVPYWIGSALTRFIVEKGGVGALRKIMRQVQVRKNRAHGWSDAESARPEELQSEEIRVRLLLKQAIQDQFSDLDAFEKEWRETVLQS
ncbi:hypothetical protein M1523_01140 [Patescibacteria group bacterium]|nr:hypothetical protein [Patescibacteria group bacterium]MCL5091212.1 hypothetical protein [Patescibacteria group bacterium]